MYRIVFLLAGIYNLVFGLWAGLCPQAFFSLIQIDSPRYPVIWACLGMVVGLYGLLYLHAAARLDRAFPIIAVGLLGKVLGPLGGCVAVSQAELPLRMLSLLVLNDLIWWLPFGLFLLEGTRVLVWIRRWPPSICAVLHLLAVALLLVGLRGGTEVEPSPHVRAEFIIRNIGIWRLGWAVWMAAAVSLIGLYAWWAARVRARRWAILGVLAAAAGLVCDLSGESLLIAWLPERAAQMLAAGGNDPAQSDFASMQQRATALTAGWANGLYTLGGIVLTLASTRLRGWFLGMTWCIWIAGIGMSVSAAAGALTGIMVSTAVLFPLFIVWSFMLGRVLR